GERFTPATSPFGDGLVNPDKNNFAPRLGLAYHVSPNWVVRAGYGRFYQLFERIGSEDQLSLNLPFLVNNVVSTSSTSVPVNGMRVNTGFNLSLDPSAVDPTRVRLRAVNPQSVIPSVDQWNEGLQRLLPITSGAQTGGSATSTTCTGWLSATCMSCRRRIEAQRAAPHEHSRISSATGGSAASRPRAPDGRSLSAPITTTVRWATAAG